MLCVLPSPMISPSSITLSSTSHQATFTTTSTSPIPSQPTIDLRSQVVGETSARRRTSSAHDLTLLHNSSCSDCVVQTGSSGPALAPAQGNAHGVNIEPTPSRLCFLVVVQSCGVDGVRKSSHHATLTPTSHPFHLHIHIQSNSINTLVAMTH